MSCVPETNHEGKVDYVEFVEMYYEPAKAIGNPSNIINKGNS